MSIEQQIKIIFLKYGVVLGLIFLALTIFSYYFITELTNSPIMFVGGPIIFRLFIPIFLTAWLCFKGRAKIGGYWTFKQATTAVFVMFLVTFAIQFTGKDILFDRVIAPQNVQKTQDASIRFKSMILAQKGVSAKDIARDNAEMRKDFAQEDGGISGIIRGVLFNVLFIFILSLIFGALFKRDPPAYAPQI
jgi:hypothetical protein